MLDIALTKGSENENISEGSENKYKQADALPEVCQVWREILKYMHNYPSDFNPALAQHTEYQNPLPGAGSEREVSVRVRVRGDLDTHVNTQHRTPTLGMWCHHPNHFIALPAEHRWREALGLAKGTSEDVIWDKANYQHFKQNILRSHSLSSSSLPPNSTKSQCLGGSTADKTRENYHKIPKIIHQIWLGSPG